VCRNSIRLRPFLYPDQTAASYVYDLVGKIQQVSDPTGTYGFAYDNMGRLIGTTTQYTFLPGHNFQNSYAYDMASNRTSLTAPDGSTNSYNYDVLNRLTTLTNSLTGQFGFGYDALSRRTQLTRPNGVNTNYNYDSVSHLLSVLHQAGSTTLDGASYSYDYAGNRTSKTNYLNGITSNYGYDAIYELQQVTQGGSTTESYSYDAVGNRLSSTGVPTYSYNSSNELTSNSSGSYTYDNNGNTLTDASGKSYTWDFENRMVSAVVPGTGTVSFKYDPFGRRIQKSSLSGSVGYIFDGANLTEELDGNGNVLARYAQGANIDEPLAELRSAVTSYYQVDGLGSVTSLTNSSGAIAETYGYDSFGKLSASTGSLVNPFQYTSREFDPETGLRYYRARYYDIGMGRFMSEDPARFNSNQLNFYSYVRNSPLVNFDPTGLALCQFFIDRKSRAGYLYCTSNDPRTPSVGFPAASGNNGEESHCRNNPDCTANEGQGPIPLGDWTWSGGRGTNHTGKGNRDLVPTPNTGTNQTEGRNGIQTHWCAHPFGPGTQPAFCSTGCVTANESDINSLNNLIDLEPGSRMLVIPIN
jgi:RHS repeat-associated protein